MEMLVLLRGPRGRPTTAEVMQERLVRDLGVLMRLRVVVNASRERQKQNGVKKGRKRSGETAGVAR